MAKRRRRRAKNTPKTKDEQRPTASLAGRLMVVPSELPRPSAKKIKARGVEFTITKPVIAGQQRVLNAFPDMPDLRDRYYQPTLQVLKPYLHPPMGVPVRDQQSEGACTGFGLATVIDVLNATRARLIAGLPEQVSARMLYEMARLHDEWPGTRYEGSSARGAVKGFYHNGVCSEVCAPFVASQNKWTLTIDAATEARSQRLGAYYRLRRSITDFHAALNETGAIYVSAYIHEGWDKSLNHSKISNIPQDSKKPLGGHAFAIVGYDDKGFFVQNSWGPKWGHKGIARWPYLDWAETLVDAWVLQLSVPAPDAFVLPRTSLSGPVEVARPSADARRGEIIGHFMNIDDGKLQEEGKYATPRSGLEETAKLIAAETAATANTKYDHLAIYAHGGLNSVDDEAARIDHLKPGFKRNRIYNYHLMWGTAAFEVFWDTLAVSARQREARMGSLITDLADEVFKSATHSKGTRIWSQIKADAKASFTPSGGGTAGLRPILKAALSGTRPLKIHLIAHSAGAILQGHLLERLAAGMAGPLTLSSVHLMAPACRTDFFNRQFAPWIAARSGNVRIEKLFIYNLSGKREEDDSVEFELLGTTIPVYFKSLLYLVSNAFEEAPEQPLAGMELFEKHLTGKPIIEHAGVNDISNSETHGGFDNDAATMNTILKRILGKPPADPFKPEELKGF